MDKKVTTIYREYRNGRLGRREFLGKLAELAGGMAAAYALLPGLEARASGPEDKTSADDPRLEAKDIAYPAGEGEMKAYLARPRGEEKHPAVIVIHENRGLVPHIRDVTRRVALEGYLALAPDALSPLGGTPADVNEGRTKMRELDSGQTEKNFAAAVAFLKTHPQTSGKVGCTGFCWGGGVTNQVAVQAPDLDAAVPFYGRQPKAEDVPRIKAALLCHYAGLDERINAGIPAFEQALQAAGIEYKMYMYEGAGHAFFNDTGSRYHPEAADLAWKRTVEFFKEKLKTGG
jgi:carboxymethylenebutenolidase